MQLVIYDSLAGWLLLLAWWRRSHYQTCLTVITLLRKYIILTVRGGIAGWLAPGFYLVVFFVVSSVNDIASLPSFDNASSDKQASKQE